MWDVIKCHLRKFFNKWCPPPRNCVPSSTCGVVVGASRGDITKGRGDSAIPIECGIEETERVAPGREAARIDQRDHAREDRRREGRAARPLPLTFEQYEVRRARVEGDVGDHA